MTDKRQMRNVALFIVLLITIVIASQCGEGWTKALKEVGFEVDLHSR